MKVDTVNHPHLVSVPQEVLVQESMEDRKRIEEMTQLRIPQR